MQESLLLVRRLRDVQTAWKRPSVVRAGGRFPLYVLMISAERAPGERH